MIYKASQLAHRRVSQFIESERTRARAPPTLPPWGPLPPSLGTPTLYLTVTAARPLQGDCRMLHISQFFKYFTNCMGKIRRNRVFLFHSSVVCPAPSSGRPELSNLVVQDLYFLILSSLSVCPKWRWQVNEYIH